jgi:PHD/YefM family antitoxin component YafN of YafNO toxin-antitoxin module
LSGSGRLLAAGLDPYYDHPMKIMTIAEAEAALDKVLESLADDSVVLTRGERDVAAVISIDDYEKLRRLKVEEFLTTCEKVGQQAEARGLTEEGLARLLGDDG